MKIEDEIKSKFRNEYHKALVNIYYTNNVVSQSFHKMLKEYKLTSQQFNILRILKGQYPKAISIGSIKERMLDKSSDVSRIINRLYMKKLIERKECLIDRRKRDLLICKNGLELLEKIKNKMEQKEDEILSNLTIEEAKTLNVLLDKIRNK